MLLTVNGERREVPDGMNLSGLLDSLGLSGAALVVERNGHVVARQDAQRVILEDGDRLELVRFVGGG